MEEKENNIVISKSGRGGRRVGSGRKPTGRTVSGKNFTITIFGTEQETSELRSLAVKNNCSLSRYVVSCIVYNEKPDSVTKTKELKERHSKSISISGTKAELDAIRAKAKEAGKLISRYIFDFFLKG